MFAGAVSIGAHLIGNTDILLVRDFDTVAHNVPEDVCVNRCIDMCVWTACVCVHGHVYRHVNDTCYCTHKMYIGMCVGLYIGMCIGRRTV